MKTVSHEFGVSCSAPLSTPKALMNAAIWSVSSFDSANSNSGLSAVFSRLKKIISPFSARALEKASLCAMVCLPAPPEAPEASRSAMASRDDETIAVSPR